MYTQDVIEELKNDVERIKKKIKAKRNWKFWKDGIESGNIILYVDPVLDWIKFDFLLINVKKDVIGKLLDKCGYIIEESNDMKIVYTYSEYNKRGKKKKDVPNNIIIESIYNENGEKIDDRFYLTYHYKWGKPKRRNVKVLEGLEYIIKLLNEGENL